MTTHTRTLTLMRVHVCVSRRPSHRLRHRRRRRRRGRRLRRDRMHSAVTHWLISRSFQASVLNMIFRTESV